MEHSTMTQIDHTTLQHVPFGLLFTDRDNRITWANQAIGEMLGLRTADLENRALEDLPEQVRELLKSEPKLVHDANTQRWMRREWHAGDDGQRLLVISDVSAQEQLAEENVRLRQQVEDLKLTDELTGMANKRAISQSLDLHISRSRRYQNPLSTVLVHVDVHELAQVQPLSTDPIVLAVSRFLRDRLRWVDQIARWEDNLFLLVLPETTEEDARGLLDKVRTEQTSLALPEGYGDSRPNLTFGLSCWQKGDDMRTLLSRALNDLKENSGL